MAIATVTSKGQVTIPVTVRNDLGLHAGSRVSFVRTDDGVYELRPQTRRVSALRGVVPHPGRPVSLAEMDEAVRAGAAGDFAP